jgi:hypothetical protein
VKKDHVGISENKVKRAILISDKVDIRAKKITRNRKEHYE